MFFHWILVFWANGKRNMTVVIEKSIIFSRAWIFLIDHRTERISFIISETESSFFFTIDEKIALSVVSAWRRNSFLINQWYFVAESESCCSMGIHCSFFNVVEWSFASKLWKNIRRLCSSFKSLWFRERIQVFGDRCVNWGFQDFLMMVSHLKSNDNFIYPRISRYQFE